MNISIFGLGHVGCVNLGCLARSGHTIIGVDTNETKVNQINSGFSAIAEKDIDHIIREEHSKQRITATKDYCKAILETEISIVAVQVPPTTTGHPDLQYVYKVAETFGRILRGKNDFHTIAIKSTVPPSTSERFADIIEEYSGKKRNIDFAVVSNPAFLRQGTAVDDYYHPPYTLIGSDHTEAAEKVASLYGHLPATVIVTTAKAAELVKYVSNTFHAMKVSFANEIGNICSAMKIDSQEVMDIFCADKTQNLSASYLKPGFAFGGAKLSQDLKVLQNMAHDNYIKTPLIESIEKTNDAQVNRAADLIQQTKKRKIGILGLSYKAGAADLRLSPAVALVETLIGRGFEVFIYDSNASHKENIRSQAPHLSKMIRSHISEVMNESELIVVNNKEKEYTDVLMNVEMEHPIIDMVRLPHEISKKKNYKGLNW